MDYEKIGERAGRWVYVVFSATCLTYLAGRMIEAYYIAQYRHG